MCAKRERDSQGLDMHSCCHRFFSRRLNSNLVSAVKSSRSPATGPFGFFVNRFC